MPRRRSGKKINFVHWTQSAGNFTPLAAGTPAAVNLFAALHEPETLLRMRGNMYAALDGNQTGNVIQAMALGIILVPEGTGTTVLWSPLTDGDAPWIWYETFALGYEEYVTDVIDATGFPMFRAIIDNKAMRISRNQEVQLVGENVTISGGSGVNAGVHIRCLTGTG